MSRQNGIVQMMDGDNPIYPITKTEAVIGAVDEQMVKRITRLTLTPQAYATGDTLPTAKTTASYYSLLIKAVPDTQFIVTGFGGSAYRLWATYNEDGTLNRREDSNKNTLDEPVTITLTGTECYLVVNTRETSASASMVQMVDVAANLQQLAETIGATIPEIKRDISDLKKPLGDIGAYQEAVVGQDFEVAVGTINSNGNNATSTNTLRTVGYIPATGAADCLFINPGSGKCQVYGYDANGTYVGRIPEVIYNYFNEPKLCTIEGAVKYRITFKKEDDSDITVNDFSTFGVAIHVIKNGQVVRTTPQAFTAVQKAQARANIGAVSVDTVNPVTDAEGEIEWQTGYFLKTDGSLITTTAKNKIGTIRVTGYHQVEFNCMTKGGGSANRYAYVVTDAAGNILQHSDVYPSSRISGPFDIVLDLADGAEYLKVSWASEEDYTPAHYLRCHADISQLYNRVTALENNAAASEQDANIENAAIQLYRTVRYNNNDYSYTRLDYVTNLIRYPDYQLPAPVVFATKVDSTAQSRHLMIADNSGYIDAYTIVLDLTSEQVEVYNLEPGKDYYYKVYKDNDPTAVIGGGLITTTGQIRFVKIAADVATNEHDWIDNVRDLGGWPASGNQRLRYGAIFRGEQFNNDDETITYITQAGIQELRRLGVSAELDLRGGAHTQSVLGSDVAYANIALDLWFYRLNIYNTITSKAQAFAGAIRQIRTWLEAGKGVYIHCAGGCDRTGALCAMIEGLCGVSENDINHDYEISNRSRAREYYTIAGGDNYDGDFKFAMEYIKGLIEYNGHIYVYYRGNYYDAEATVTDYTPVPLTDATLIANLAANNYGSLQDRFERLMCGIGGLTRNEVERLRTVLCS